MQILGIVGIRALYNILEEFKDYLSFQIVNYDEKNEFIKFINQKKTDNSNLLILTKITNKDFFFKKTDFEKKNIFFLSPKEQGELNLGSKILKYPIEISILIEKINIQLIKQNYNYQSKINLGKYYLDLNSRIILDGSNKLKLTEKEMEIILFLHKNKNPQKINILQKYVWRYSSELETHTVETHIYRLRKKMNDNFQDDNFIISTEDGYFIK